MIINKRKYYEERTKKEEKNAIQGEVKNNGIREMSRKEERGERFMEREEMMMGKNKRKSEEEEEEEIAVLVNVINEMEGINARV